MLPQEIFRWFRFPSKLQAHLIELFNTERLLRTPNRLPLKAIELLPMIIPHSMLFTGCIQLEEASAIDIDSEWNAWKCLKMFTGFNRIHWCARRALLIVNRKCFSLEVIDIFGVGLFAYATAWYESTWTVLLTLLSRITKTLAYDNFHGNIRRTMTSDESKSLWLWLVIVGEVKVCSANSLVMWANVMQYTNLGCKLNR